MKAHQRQGAKAKDEMRRILTDPRRQQHEQDAAMFAAFERLERERQQRQERQQ